MKAIISLLLFGAVLLLGCQHRQSSKAKLKTSESEIAHSEEAVAEGDKTKPNQDENMGKMTEIGPKVIQGTLYHSKGRMGELGGMILSSEFLRSGEGAQWKPEYEALVGKKVEAKGIHFRYVCSPIEQCLEGGVINYLQEITYLKAID